MKILSKLSRVTQIRDNYWKACCPAHDDKSPSLCVSVKDNKILLKCWSGCDTVSIVNAVDLRMGDLFLDGCEKYIPKEKVSLDEIIVKIASFDKANGKTLSDQDRERAAQAQLAIKQSTKR